MSLEYTAAKLTSAINLSSTAATTHAAEAAAARADDWSAVLNSALVGRTTPGSRTPVRDRRASVTQGPLGDLPPFITPQVVDGGFVTGRLCAGGPLLPFEQLLVRQVLPKMKPSQGHSLSAADFESVYAEALSLPFEYGHETEGTSSSSSKRKRKPRDAPLKLRENLNAAFLTPAGVTFLQTLLCTRRYLVKYPEEAALPTAVALLLPSTSTSSPPNADRAAELIHLLAPYFQLVRFYPRPATAPIPLRLACSLTTPAYAKQELGAIVRGGVPNFGRRFITMKLVIERLLPSYDALLSLVLATCARLPWNIRQDRTAPGSTADGTASHEDDRMLLLPFQKTPTGAIRSFFRALNEQFEQATKDYQQLTDHRRGSKQLRVLDAKRSARGFILECARKFFVKKGKGRLPSCDVRHVQHVLQQIQGKGRRCQLPVVWQDNMSLEDFGVGIESQAHLCQQGVHVGDGTSSGMSPNTSNQTLPDPLRALRARQRVDARKSVTTLTPSWAYALQERLATHCSDQCAGLFDVSPLLAASGIGEQVRFHISLGSALPLRGARLMRRLECIEFSRLLSLPDRENLVASMEEFSRVAGGFVDGARLGGSVVSVTDGGAEEECEDGAESAQVRVANSVKGLHLAASAAFRSRRSLLLLGFSRQVRREDLPWTRQLDPLLKAVCGKVAISSRLECVRGLFATITRECLTRWPSKIVPNTMVELLERCASVADLDAVLRERNDGSWGGHWYRLMPELAADIFEGGFTVTWTQHAEVAAGLLRGTLYDVYYMRDVLEPRMEDGKDGKRHVSWSGLSLWDVCGDSNRPLHKRGVAIRQLCTRSAGLDIGINEGRTRMFVPANGVFIETGMLLTGHNYPILVRALQGLGHPLSAEEIVQAAIKGYNAVCAMMSPVVASKRAKNTAQGSGSSYHPHNSDSIAKVHANLDWNSQLRTAKNVAFGWRQVVLLLSLLKESRHVSEFFARVLGPTEGSVAVLGEQVMRRYARDLRKAWYVVQRQRTEGSRTTAGRLSWKPLRGWSISGDHPLLS